MYVAMVNGPCGVGKSETCRELQSRQPGSELIRLDDVRKTIPEQQFMSDGAPDAVARMWHANVVGREIAQTALNEGRSVIVDAVKYQTEWVEPWEELGREAGAIVLDICLMAPKDVVAKRAAERGYKPGGRLTPQKVSDLYDKVEAFYLDRPEAIIIDTELLSIRSTACIINNLMQDPA